MKSRLAAALLAAVVLAGPATARPGDATSAAAATPLRVVSLVMHVHTTSTKDGFQAVVVAATRYLGATPVFFGGSGNAQGTVGFSNFRVTLHGVAMLGIVGAQREKSDVLGLVVYDHADRFKSSGPRLMKAAAASPSA
jgi:ABC-type sugar transport system substrate-binding protein